ncbi:hypothetical protein N665_2093s0001 [Sinapis alba]|nr:hypothetical protein N665_2093s0001 [Sinapis alba]
MSSDSSASSGQAGRRSVFGVPSRSWCGQTLDIWVSETKENPCRRFYRCKIALQKKTESHLFKWVDEAVLDEVRMVDAKILDLHHDFKALTAKTNIQIEMHNEINGKMTNLANSIEDTTIQIKDQILSELRNHSNTNVNPHPSNFFNTPYLSGAALAFCGVMSYVYWKLL